LSQKDDEEDMTVRELHPNPLAPTVPTQTRKKRRTASTSKAPL
jgi:hypothetical protein